MEFLWGGVLSDIFSTDLPLEAKFLAAFKSVAAPKRQQPKTFVVFKYVCDKGFAIATLPFVLCIALVLLVLNPAFNPGPLFFRQERMGMGGRRFTMWKFRTMKMTETKVRGHDEPLEENRIRTFARFLRRSRIDELPNVLSILIGDMSLVGPRPDVWTHSTYYINTIAFYSERFQVRPGITGLAQVRGGYADTTRSIERKARLDYHYVKHSRIKLDLHILWCTVIVVLTGFGAK